MGEEDTLDEIIYKIINELRENKAKIIEDFIKTYLAVQDVPEETLKRLMRKMVLNEQKADLGSQQLGYRYWITFDADKQNNIGENNE